ncbi:transcriptional repressor [Entomophthora muscae]|uniref:Transcriptional repressor n=2 Tax=Entomophthora muscae TaxID=34485 RepID=A0ACC2RX29_9FUNG|nr:transcriptional repressor [Entomophthora muscae]KAJ9062797.1 transcriptional repressor [Entomophthora muscae]
MFDQVYKGRGGAEEGMPDKFTIINASGCRVNLLQTGAEDLASFGDLPTYPFSRSAKGAKRHKCTYPNCGRTFSTSGHLTRHFRIHTGEKNFKCLRPHCHARFSRQDNMMQHYRTHLPSKPPHPIYPNSHAAALNSLSSTPNLSH